MLAIDRWRNWRPLDEKFGDSHEREPSKPSEPTFEGFEGSTSEQIQNFTDRSPDAPEACREDFAGWVAANCLRREGKDDWGGIGALLVSFALWRAARGTVPCARVTFELLLQDAGFRLKDGLVCGLVLREDLWALEPVHGAPEGARPPAQAAASRRRTRGAA